MCLIRVQYLKADCDVYRCVSSMTAQDDIVESLHSTIKFEFHLSGIFLCNFLMRLHCANFVNPSGHSVQSLVVCGQIWIVLESLLNISQCWQKLISWANVQRKHILRCNELCRNIKHSLGQVSVCFFTFVIRLASFEEWLGRLAVLDVILVHEGVEAGKILNRLRAQLVLMEQWAELIVIFGTWNFAWGVRKLL